MSHWGWTTLENIGGLAGWLPFVERKLLSRVPEVLKVWRDLHRPGECESTEAAWNRASALPAAEYRILAALDDAILDVEYLRLRIDWGV